MKTKWMAIAVTGEDVDKNNNFMKRSYQCILISCISTKITLKSNRTGKSEMGSIELMRTLIQRTQH